MIRLAVRVARADAADALAELLVFSPAGVEERDGDGDAIEYVLYGSPGELPSRQVLQARVGDALLDVSASEIADDWASRWRTFHRPVEISGRLHVRPPWCEPPSDDAQLIDIVIEPGQAFGTGAHATTQLCLELLVGLASGVEVGGRMALLDLGCGSGVLAIAAAKLGFAPVSAVDHEPESVDATRANAAANGVEVECALLDLLSDELPRAPLVVANLLAPLLHELAARLVETPSLLIASGLLREQADGVAAVFAQRHGMRERSRSHDGEWAALLLEGAPGGRILSGR
jgi:ribosomal protein L11 methyltransferase